MIKTKDDLRYYIESDLRSQGYDGVTLKMIVFSWFIPCIWKFEILLRKAEYYHNNQDLWLNKLLFKYYYIRMLKYGLNLGFSIPINVFGPGLCICHAGTLIINENVSVGSNARIHAGVNIGNYSKFGEGWKKDNAPIIGNNVYIGPGAKLFGKIKVGDDVAIGANAVVTKDVRDHVTVVGVPAKIINEYGSINMLLYGDTRI